MPSSETVASGPQRCKAPDEYQWFETTSREQALAEARAGPDRRWTQQVHAAKVVRPATTAEVCPPQEKGKLEAMQRLEESGMFKPLEHASSTLPTMVRNITLDSASNGNAPTVVQVLEGMVDTPPLVERRSSSAIGHAGTREARRRPS